MKTVLVMPGEGRRVRMPNHAVLDAKDPPKQPVTVKRTIFVERRLLCGDLVEILPAAPAAPATPAAGKLPAPEVKAS